MRSYRGVFFALFTAAARRARLFSPYYVSVAFLWRIITAAALNHGPKRFRRLIYEYRNESMWIIFTYLLHRYS